MRPFLSTRAANGWKKPLEICVAWSSFRRKIWVPTRPRIARPSGGHRRAVVQRLLDHLPVTGIGKLVIGVYFWDHFALIMGETVTSGKSFSDTERRLGDVSGHDEIGQLVLTRSNLSPLVCDAVGLHHDLPVACLRRNHQRTGTEFPTGARFAAIHMCWRLWERHNRISIRFVTPWDPPSWLR